MEGFISIEWLHSHLDQKNLVIIDCRADLEDKEFGKFLYSKTHIAGAIFVDGEKVLTGSVEKEGGRHPLPDYADFIKNMEKTGISDGSQVILYGLYEARLFFMLRNIGIKSYILDGGIEQWMDAGFPVTNEIENSLPGKISSKNDSWNIVTKEYLKKRINNPDLILVDARSPERYSGELETIDPVAGRIPGAINLFYMDFFTDDGTLKPENELKNITAQLVKEKEIITYCGSGITACYDYVILLELGLSPNLYSGGWSDWISTPDYPIEKD